MHNALLITLSLFASSALAGQTFACGNAKIPLRIDPGTGHDVTQQTCLTVNHGNAPYYTYHDGDVSANLAHTNQIPAHSTCEHIMEVQMLKQVLESPNGPCAQLALETDPARRLVMRQNFRIVTDILNSPPNLVFADDTLETQKGDMVNKAQSGKPYKEKPGDPNLRNRLIAVDHFVNAQTGALSTQVAHALDVAIAHHFPGTADTVAARWAAVMAFAHTCYSGLKPHTLEHDEQTSLTNMVVERVLRVLNFAP